MEEDPSRKFKNWEKNAAKNGVRRGILLVWGGGQTRGTLG